MTCIWGGPTASKLAIKRHFSKRFRRIPSEKQNWLMIFLIHDIMVWFLNIPQRPMD
jgi:hypothetical protein